MKAAHNPSFCYRLSDALHPQQSSEATTIKYKEKNVTWRVYMANYYKQGVLSVLIATRTKPCDRRTENKQHYCLELPVAIATTLNLTTTYCTVSVYVLKAIFIALPMSQCPNYSSENQFSMPWLVRRHTVSPLHRHFNQIYIVKRTSTKQKINNVEVANSTNNTNKIASKYSGLNNKMSLNRDNDPFTYMSMKKSRKSIVNSWNSFSVRKLSANKTQEEEVVGKVRFCLEAYLSNGWRRIHWVTGTATRRIEALLNS